MRSDRPSREGEGAVLETPRLVLRRMTPNDREPLLEVFGDPEVMRHYPAPFTRPQMKEWIDWNLRNYAEHGYGLWSLVLKATGEVIGDCGLTWQRVGYSDHRDLEAGWHTRRDLWNRGLATEAALCVRAYAQEALGRGRLIAIIAPDNLSSQAVARKMGMAFERTDWLDGKQRQIFAVELA